MQKPTKKQATLLKFIDNYTTEKNHSPSYREIQSALGLGSVATVAQHIDNCVQAGFLKKSPNTARSLEVVSFEEYKETTHLLRHKIAELNQQIAEGGAELCEAKTQAIRDDIMVLKSAAKILDLDL